MAPDEKSDTQKVEVPTAPERREIERPQSGSQRRKLTKTRPLLREDLAAMTAALDSRTPIIERYERENPEFHYSWQDPQTPASSLRDQGYEPVTEHGEQVHSGPDPLWRCPKEAFLERRSVATALSKAAISDQVQKERDAGAIPDHVYG